METKTKIAQAYLMDIITSSPVGEKLPSERELVSHLNFSRPIIQRAIDNLLAEGYIYKVDRQGAFIAKNTLSNSLNRLSSFNETAQDIGTRASSEVIEKSIILADSFLASKMDCDVGDKIYYFLRLRKHSDTPIMVDYSYFTEFSISGISSQYLEGSIYKYIEQMKNLSIGSCASMIDAVLPEPEIAAMLKISCEEPLLQLDRVSRLSDGRIFEHTISYIVSRYYKISVNSFR
ncbi:MAG: GntR family transcriptional regulator [Clostridia bacterium]